MLAVYYYITLYGEQVCIVTSVVALEHRVREWHLRRGYYSTAYIKHKKVYT